MTNKNQMQKYLRYLTQKTKPWFGMPFTAAGQKMEQTYSYNPTAHWDILI